MQRRIDRQRRANNPGNYLPDGRIRPGPKRWRTSNKQRRAQAKLAETQRKAAARRKSLHGQMANTLLKLGNDIRIEKNSYRSFQRNFGKSVGQAAPAGFVSLLGRKAANAGAQVSQLPTSLRLSQMCHGCGGIKRKPLSLRVHQCECGIGPVQRDVYSAWLACSAVPSDKLEWRLDANQAALAWLGAESLGLFRELQIEWGIVYALVNMGRVELYLGNHQQASPLLAEGLALCQRLGNRDVLAEYLETSAATIGSTIPPAERPHYQQMVTFACGTLDQATLAAAWAEGRAMTLEQAIAHVLGNIEPHR